MNSSYRLVETQAPLSEPIDLAETKTFLRVEGSENDSLILSLITAARIYCESFTGRSLINRNYSLFLDHWPGTTSLPWWDGIQEGADILVKNSVLYLPRGPLVSVGAIKIYDADSVAATFSASGYFVDTVGSSGRVVLKDGVMPPIPGRVANGIEVQFTAGYGTAASQVPTPLKQGMKQMVAHMHEFRGDTPHQALFSCGAEFLFRPYQTLGIA